MGLGVLRGGIRDGRGLLSQVSTTTTRKHFFLWAFSLISCICQVSYHTLHRIKHSARPVCCHRALPLLDKVQRFTQCLSTSFHFEDAFLLKLQLGLLFVHRAQISILTPTFRRNIKDRLFMFLSSLALLPHPQSILHHPPTHNSSSPLLHATANKVGRCSNCHGCCLVPDSLWSFLHHGQSYRHPELSTTEFVRCSN